MIEIDTYRISRGIDRWRRRWQAEWNGCQRAPRAWTERGVIRKAYRSIAKESKGPEGAGESTSTEVARALCCIARDVRSAGDVPLVRFDDDGVTQVPYTLADELWLNALLLDADVAMADGRREADQ